MEGRNRERKGGKERKKTRRDKHMERERDEKMVETEVKRFIVMLSHDSLSLSRFVCVCVCRCVCVCVCVLVMYITHA